VVVAGQQQATRDWWQQRRTRFDLFVSGLVPLECRRGDPQAAKARLAEIDRLPVLEFSAPTQALAQAILDTKLIPAKAGPDAAHIAIAAVHGIDFLVTWSCRHIANAAIVEGIRRVCAEAGFPAPVICTPLN
jgi:predicted nucleic acid-binding protein